MRKYNPLTIQAVRDYLVLHTASMMIAITCAGTAFAYFRRYTFKADLFVAMICASFFSLLGTNAFNSYSEACEYEQGNSKVQKYILSNPQSVPSHHINPKIVLVSGLICYLFVVVAGIYLILHSSLILLWIGLFGIIVGFTYTNGPFPLIKYPITELLSGICVGGLIFFVSFYVQSAVIDIETMITSILFVAAVSLVNANNHLCDAEKDILTDRGTVAIVFGKSVAIGQILVLFVAVYLVWLYLGFVGILGVYALFAIFPFFCMMKYLLLLRSLGYPSHRHKSSLEKWIVLHVFANVASLIAGLFFKWYM
ncbi:MAG TPA: prenyltransferase [Spirochaetota bacterium]